MAAPSRFKRTGGLPKPSALSGANPMPPHTCAQQPALNSHLASTEELHAVDAGRQSITAWAPDRQPAHQAWHRDAPLPICRSFWLCWEAGPGWKQRLQQKAAAGRQL